MRRKRLGCEVRHTGSRSLPSASDGYLLRGRAPDSDPYLLRPRAAGSDPYLLKGRRGRGRQGGQAIAEFCLVLTVMLGLTLTVLDVSRAFFQYISVQSASRSAAEYIATNDTNYTNALADATKVVCTELTGSSTCPAGSGITITVTFPSATVSSPYSTKTPLQSAKVVVNLTFRTVIPWSSLGASAGSWTLTGTNSFQVVQGRV